MNRITVVGCGFVGSIFANEYAKLAFAGELPESFRFIDGDVWERRNSANQNVTLVEATERMPKAQTLMQALHAFEKEADAIHDRVTTDTIDSYLKGSSIIVDAVDNLATRQLLYGYGMGHGIPVMHIGITEMGTGSVEWSHPEHDRFALSPARTAGKDIKDPKTSSLPPCELASMRPVGWHAGYCAAMSMALYHGFDTWGWVEGKPHFWMTEWQVNRFGYEPVRETWDKVVPHE